MKSLDRILKILRINIKTPKPIDVLKMAAVLFAAATILLLLLKFLIATTAFWGKTAAIAVCIVGAAWSLLDKLRTQQIEQQQIREHNDRLILAKFLLELDKNGDVYQFPLRILERFTQSELAGKVNIIYKDGNAVYVFDLRLQVLPQFKILSSIELYYSIISSMETFAHIFLKDEHMLPIGTGIIIEDVRVYGDDRMSVELFIAQDFYANLKPNTKNNIGTNFEDQFIS